MVDIQTGLAINTAVPGDRTIAQSFRRVLGQLFPQTAVGTVIPGVIGIDGLTPLTVSTDGSAMEYHVSAGYALMGRTAQGAYIAGTTADIDLVGVSPGDGSNPRLDRIFIVQPDPELAESGVAKVDWVEGTPGSTPSLPALPTGALELARKLVPAGATNTADGTALSNQALVIGVSVLAANVGGLSTLLAGKSNVGHTHVVSAITDLATNGDVKRVQGKQIIVQPTGSSVPVGLAKGDVVIEAVYTP